MTTPITSRVLGCLLGCAVSTVLGCGPGSSTAEKTTGVWGDVTFKGVPLDEGTIEFEHSPARWIQGSAAIEKGKYKAALPAGSYRVMIYASHLGQPGEPGYSPGDYVMYIPPW